MNQEPDLSDRSDTKRLRFDGTINLGHILTAATMIVGLSAVWADNKVNNADHNFRLSQLEHSQVELRETLAKLAENASQTNRTQDKLALTLEYLAKQVSKP